MGPTPLCWRLCFCVYVLITTASSFGSRSFARICVLPATNVRKHRVVLNFVIANVPHGVGFPFYEHEMKNITPSHTPRCTAQRLSGFKWVLLVPALCISHMLTFGFSTHAPFIHALIVYGHLSVFVVVMIMIMNRSHLSPSHLFLEPSLMQGCYFQIYRILSHHVFISPIIVANQQFRMRILAAFGVTCANFWNLCVENECSGML